MRLMSVCEGWDSAQMCTSTEASSATNGVCVLETWLQRYDNKCIHELM